MTQDTHISLAHGHGGRLMLDPTRGGPAALAGAPDISRNQRQPAKEMELYRRFIRSN
jgi:hypothetical protein